MDWRQNSKGQSYRKLNGITSLYEDKTVLQSFFYFNEETCTILLRAGKKPTFIYKNLEHKSTTVQLGSGRTVEGFFVYCLSSKPSHFLLSLDHRQKQTGHRCSLIYGTTYHVSRLPPSVVPNSLLISSPHRRRQHHFTPTLTNRALRLPGLQAVRWLFLTKSSKPIILVWMEPLQSAFF